MSLFDYSQLLEAIEDSPLSVWTPDIQRLIKENLVESNNGHLATWKATLDELPQIVDGNFEIEAGVHFAKGCELDGVKEELLKLHPWRKGPISLGGVCIETEWRSDWKWERLKDDIAPLENRLVLDIGCGNGYYLWRMLGAGAKLALGIDPFLLFVMQFWAVKRFAPGKLPVWVLPMGWEELPEELPHFDTVFSMGVLYHRRDPQEFLEQLQNYAKPGGELVLETLVVDGDEGEVLVPQGRYAKMRNVWYIPTVATLVSALKDAGWENVRCIDVSVTVLEEQRSTEWMHFESLSDFLDPNDASKTIEGYPAPCRAVLLANKRAV